MEMDENLQSTISFERIENESAVKAMVECDLGALEVDYDFADLAKSQLFHFFENGDKFIGEWKMGEPWNIEYFDKKGELIGEIYREGEFPSNNDLKVYDRNGEIIDYSL